MVIGDRFADVIASAKSGEEQGFEELHRDLASTLYGYARGRGASEPEDVVTDTMLAVARGVAGFVGDEKAFRSWVFSICYCKIVDERRKSKRRVPSRSLRPGDEGSGAPSAEDAALESIADKVVVEALQSLTPEQRDVVLLRVIGDVPVKEVAKILGKKESAVKMIQLRALEQLRSRLGRKVSWI